MKLIFKSINFYDSNDLLSDFQKADQAYCRNLCKMSFQTFNKLFEIIINFIIEMLKKLKSHKITEIN